MLFYVKCHGAPNRAPKTSLIDMTRTTRAQFLPSFAKNGNPEKLQANSAQKKMRLNNLDIDLNSTQSRCQFGAKNAFPKATQNLTSQFYNFIFCLLSFSKLLRLFLSLCFSKFLEFS